MNNTTFAIITIFILLLIYIINLFCVDHFKPINSLKIKYNNDKILIPNQFKQSNYSESEPIAEINKHPLQWNNQLYSMHTYPFIGTKQKCKVNSDCSQITSECKILDNKKNEGICILKNPTKTVFDIKF